MLNLACDRGMEWLVTELLQRGADANLQANIGRFTPLMCAAYHGHDGVAKTLLRSGARTDLVNEGNVTALQIAEGRGHSSVARVILGSMMIDVVQVGLACMR